MGSSIYIIYRSVNRDNAISFVIRLESESNMLARHTMDLGGRSYGYKYTKYWAKANFYYLQQTTSTEFYSRKKEGNGGETSKVHR